MMTEETDGEQGPRSTFTIYMAEGEQLYHKGEYSKAKESFSNALELQPTDKHCLVARSKCFLKLGDPEAALRDAEASLQEESCFFRGLYQKAEALYAMGDFEFALVFYHRGYKLRPELQEFCLGIQKTQEAIENSVGTPASVKLENKEGVAFLSKQEESKKAKQKAPAKVPKKDPKQQKKADPSKSQKCTRQLLGELYNDMEYLETLLKDEGLVKGNARSGLKLQDLIMNAITYLDTRTEFWRQQKPIYARERDHRIMQQKWYRPRAKPSDSHQYVLKNMEEIDLLLSKGDAEGSYKKAQQVLKNIHSWKDNVPNKQELIGNLYSCIGNAQMDMGQMEEALKSHKNDLQIAKQCDLPDAKSRALDNVGRVYARIGRFNEAVEVWEEKIPMATSNLEKTWLFHEIGRCYLELELLEEARNYGVKSQEEAEEAGDVEWQLNASVLVAQAHVKLKDYQSAVNNFEKALEKARIVNNTDAEQAILTALEEAKKKSEAPQDLENSVREDSPRVELKDYQSPVDNFEKALEKARIVNNSDAAILTALEDAKKKSEEPQDLENSVREDSPRVEVKDYQSAVNNFEKAFEKARIVNNTDAEQAILTALKDAKKKSEAPQDLENSVREDTPRVELKDYQSAVNNFENALEKARIVNNTDAEQAILTALEDAKKKSETPQDLENSVREDSPGEEHLLSEENQDHISSKENQEHISNKENQGGESPDISESPWCDTPIIP